MDKVMLAGRARCNLRGFIYFKAETNGAEQKRRSGNGKRKSKMV